MTYPKQLEAKRQLLCTQARALACAFFLRDQPIPEKLKQILAATNSLEALEKYNPNWQNQPRVPSGNPNGGQWTSGGGSSAGSTTTAKPKAPKKPVGSFSIPDAIWHYFTGNGKPVTVNFSEVDIGLQPHDFPKYKKLVQSMHKRQGRLDVDEQISRDIGGQYGHVSFVLRGTIRATPYNWTFEGYTGALEDDFNFDTKPWGVRDYWKERVTRLIGSIPVGTPYPIEFIGKRKIKDEGKW